MKKPIRLETLAVTFDKRHSRDGLIDLPLTSQRGSVHVTDSTFASDKVQYRMFLVGMRSDQACELTLEANDIERTAHFQKACEVMFDPWLVEPGRRLHVYVKPLKDRVLNATLRIDFLGWEIGDHLPIEEIRRIASEQGYPLS